MVKQDYHGAWPREIYFWYKYNILWEVWNCKTIQRLKNYKTFWLTETKLNLPGNKYYNIHMPWVYKCKGYGQIFGEIFSYVDSASPNLPDEEVLCK